MGKKKTDRIQADIDIALLIGKDAFRIGVGDNGQLDVDELVAKSEADTQLTNELCSWLSERSDSFSKADSYMFAARTLFTEILENIGPETAVRIFRLAMRRKRGKSYDPTIERALCFHAEMTGNTYKTAKFAHETHGIGNSVAALQKHIQRLLAESGDKKPRTKSRDK